MYKYYRPGSISLIGLPVLCLLYLNYTQVFKQEYLLPVFRITKAFYQPAVNESTRLIPPPDRINTRFEITGNPTDDSISLAQAEGILRKITMGEDTTHGVYFHFKPQSTYAGFVAVLNSCLKAGALHYITLENDVKAYFTEIRPPVRWNPGFGLHHCIQTERLNKRQADHHLSGKVYFAIGMAFLFLIAVPWFVYENYQRRSY